MFVHDLLPVSPLRRHLLTADAGDAGAGGAGPGGGGGGTQPAGGAPAGGAPAGGQPAGGAPDSGTLPTDPAELQRMIKELRNENAGHRTKVKELEPLAKKAEELENANKTEAQRQADALAAATKERDERAAAALRLEVAIAKGIDAEGLKLMPSTGTKEDFEAAADLIISYRGQSNAPRRPAPNGMQGTTPGSTANPSARDEFAAFLQQQLKAPQS